MRHPTGACLAPLEDIEAASRIHLVPAGVRTPEMIEMVGCEMSITQMTDCADDMFHGDP